MKRIKIHSTIKKANLCNPFSSVGIFKIGIKKPYKKREDLYTNRLAKQI